MSSQIVRRSEAHDEGAPQILRLGPDRASVSGTVAQVDDVIARLRADGQLAAVSNPVPNGHPGGVLVTVRVLAPQRRLPAVEPQRRTRWTRNWVIAAVVAVVTVLTLCGVAVRAAYLWTVAHAAGIESAGLAIVAVIAIAVIAVVVKALGGGRTFSGTFQGRIR